MTALLTATTFLLLQLLCQVFVTDGFGCHAPSDYVTFPEYNAAYKVHRDDVRWAEARYQCIEEGAHLAVITTVEQIKDVINSTILDSEMFMFTGIHRSAATRQWVRVDNGLPVTSIPLSAFDDREGSDCAVIWREVGGSFTDYDCDSRLAFVCETSLAEGCASRPVGHQDSHGSLASEGDTEQELAEK